MQPFTPEDLAREWTDEENRAFDKDEARRDAEAELADNDEDQGDDKPPPSRAARTIAQAEDRAAYMAERRAEIAKLDTAIERITGALRLIEGKDDDESNATRAHLRTQLERMRKQRDWDAHKLGGEDRDTLYRAKLAVRKKAEKTTRRHKGKWVRGTHYASKPRERAGDWYYRKKPEAVERLIEEGKLSPIDGTYAGIIARHLETHRRSKSDKTRRITHEELAAQIGRERKSAWRSVQRLRDSGALLVLDDGNGSHRGALYSFRARGD